MQSKMDIFWSPTPRVDQFFLIQSSDISLFALRPFYRHTNHVGVNGQSPSSNNGLSPPASCSTTTTTLPPLLLDDNRQRQQDAVVADLLCRRDDVSFIKCADVRWSAAAAADCASARRSLLAVGQLNGRVLLTTPSSLSEDDFSDASCLIGRELAPKHSRACLCLAWNRCQTNLLAFGLDKHRADNSLLVWDVECCDNNNANVLLNKATYETAQSESCYSLAWMKQNPRLLAAGLSNKSIKIYDLDDFGRPKIVVPSKTCHGLCVDPFYDHRLAAFNEFQISIFDLRQADKPLMTVNEQKPVLKIQFDPVKRNNLAALTKDSSYLKIYSLQQTVNEDTEMSFVENLVQPKFYDPASPPLTLASFAYHPVDENRLIFAQTDGRPTYARPYFYLPIQFAPDVCRDVNVENRLLMGFPKILAQCQVKFPDDEEDVSTKMKRRALSGYGIKSCQTETERQILQKSLELCSQSPDEEPYRQIWSFMLKTNNLAGEECEKWSYDIKYPGALTIVQQAKTTSSMDYRSLLGLDATGHTLMTKFYVSPERERLLNLCGWGGMAKDRFPAHNDLFLQKMLLEKQTERAAAVCLFTLRLKMAVQILTGASTSQNEEQQKSFNLIALALAGFPGLSDKENFMNNATGCPNSNNLWLEMCEQALNAVQSPFLRAAFQFLVCKCKGANCYDQVLETPNFPILDKIAFAAVHFTDQNLTEFLRRNLRHYTQNGDLTGLIICGLHDGNCSKLVQNFLDKTGDVQTAALLLLHAGCRFRKTPAQTSRAADAGPLTSTSGVFDTAKTSGGGETLDDDFRRIVLCYLRLLDAWRLWHVRAETELNFTTSTLNLLTAAAPMSTVAVQAQLVCNFCAKKIAAAPPPPLTTSAAAAAAARLLPRYAKPVSCPFCKKPLPRCVLCRLHVGGTSSSFFSRDKVNKFDNWFSWCQSCKHGGHAGHIEEWFKCHPECPVAGCLCRCSSLDN